jgi:hypothetical protein
MVTACNGRLGMQFFFIFFQTTRLPKMKSNQDSGLPGLENKMHKRWTQKRKTERGGG